MLCQYKNLLGKVGEGVHSYRIANLAVVDILLTILLAFLIYLMLPMYGFGYILLAVFLLGIILHQIFCVKTTIDKWIFG
jgi:hypothetical protein